MNIGIVGSRKFTSKSSISKLVNSLSKNDVIVSGGCSGPDSWAEDAAKMNGLSTLIFLPKLPPKGSPRYEFTKAYYERNKKIAENSDVIHAFVAKDRKGGTENTIKHALSLGKEVVIHEE